MGVDFERLEVPLEAKRDRLEDFISSYVDG
jgi:hypothetical protein